MHKKDAKKLLGYRTVLCPVRLDVPNGDYSMKEEYIYSIQFRDNKNVATSVVSPASSKVLGKLDVTTESSLPQSGSDVKQEFSADDDTAELDEA